MDTTGTTITATTISTEMGPTLEYFWAEGTAGELAATVEWARGLIALPGVRSVNMVRVRGELAGVILTQEPGQMVVLQPGTRFVIAAGSIAVRPETNPNPTTEGKSNR